MYNLINCPRNGTISSRLTKDRRDVQSFPGFRNLGRIRLSKSFFLRDFLHSEIGAFYGIRNVPSDLDLAVHTGQQLCEHLLEPLQDTFGRIHIRSGYRSPELNDFGCKRRLKCASNENTFADHIWDVRDKDGNAGACVCVVVPWLLDRVRKPGDWMRLAWWVHDHLPYHRLVFFAYQTAFNISWRDNPERLIRSFAEPQGRLTGPGMLNSAGSHFDQYEGFPPFRGIKWPPASELPPCNALHAMPACKRAS